MGGILDKANIGITFLIDNKIKFVNEKFLHLTDYSEEEIIEKSFIFLSTNEEKERLRNIEIKLSEQEIHPKIIEFWIETKNGVRKYIRNNYYASEDSKQMEGFLVLTHDLTKEKSKEVKVLASEFKKSRFLDFLSEQIIFYDTDLRIIWTNKAASDSVGEIPESMVGEICYELWYQSDTPCSNCPVLKAKETRQEQSAEVVTPDDKVWNIRGYPVYGEDGTLIGMAELASDITESKQKMKDLAKSEERFKQIFHNTNDGIFVVTRDTEGKFIKIIEANEIASRMYGYTREEFFEMKPADFNITGEEETLEFINNLLEEKRLTFERNHRTKDGNLILVEISAHLFTLGEDTVSIAIIRDITEKKKADEELIDREEKFRQIFQNSSDAIFIHSLSSDGKPGNFIEVNDIGCEWTGYSREVLLKISPPELVFENAAHDDDISKKLQSMGFLTYDGFIQNKDGYLRNVEYNSSMFVLKGERVILTTARDITERLISQQEMKESEERFRKLFETIPDALIAADLNGDITYANYQAAKLYGVESIDKLMNENTFQFIAQEDLMRAQNGFKAILTSGYVRNKQFHIVDKDGSRTPVETNASVILDSEGNPNGFIAVVRDISEKLKAEKSIQDSEEKFRQIFHSGNDAIFIHKLTRDGKLGNFIEVNSVASAWTGYDREKLLTMKPADIKWPGLVNHTKNIGKELLSTGSTTFEGTIVHKNGSSKPVEFSSQLFLLKDQVVILSVARDITERKKSQKEIEESEEKFRQIFHKANDAFFLTKLIKEDETSKFIEVNDIACIWLEYTKEEILELRSIDITAPEQKDANKEIIREIYDKGYGTFETVLLGKNDKRIPVEISSHIFELWDEEVVLTIARNITDRRRAEKEIQESEERYRQVFHNSGDIIAIVSVPRDRSIGNLLEFNELACRKLEYSREDLIGLGLDEIVKDLTEEDITKYFKEIMEKKSVKFERKLVTKSGESFPVEINAAPFLLKGEITVLLTARDITERVKDEELMKQAFAQIDQNIEDFDILVDKIRNPLTGIVGYSELSDSLHTSIIVEEAMKIDEIIKQISENWIASEKFREILRKHLLAEQTSEEDSSKNTEDVVTEVKEGTAEIKTEETSTAK